MNDAPNVFMQKQYGDEQPVARPAVVDVVRATVA